MSHLPDIRMPGHSQVQRHLWSSALTALLAVIPTLGYPADVSSVLEKLGKAKEARDQIRPKDRPATPGADNAAPVEVAAARAPGSPEPMRTLTAMQMQWYVDTCIRSQPQEVTCTITVTNQAGDKRIRIARNNFQLIDSSGTEYSASGGGFGQHENNYQEIMFATGVPTRGTFRFTGVDPRATHVARLGFMRNDNPVVWSDVPLGRAGEAQAQKRNWKDKLLGADKASAPAGGPVVVPTAPAAPAAPGVAPTVATQAPAAVVAALPMAAPPAPVSTTPAAPAVARAVSPVVAPPVPAQPQPVAVAKAVAAPAPTAAPAPPPKPPERIMAVAKPAVHAPPPAPARPGSAPQR